ncbi:MAG: MATE family efflux transporter, partial [Bilophila sp.]
FFFGISIMISVGGTVRSARYVGEGNLVAASAMFSKSMIAQAVIGTLFAIASLIFCDPLLRMLGAEGALLEPARVYLQTLMWFGPIIPCAYGLSQFARVDQHPTLASFGLALSAGMNVILDYFFIAVWDMGVFGAALATELGYACTMLLFIGHFLSRRAGLRFFVPRNGWKELVASSLNGGAECINELSVGTVILLFNHTMIARFGAEGVAAFTIINYTTWFGLTLAYGLSDTLAPLVSANHGAGRHDRTHAFLVIALVTLFGLGLGMFALFTALPNQIIELFLPGDVGVARIASAFIADYRWCFLLSGVNMGLVCYFTGLHLVRQAMSTALLRSLILPALLLLLLPLWWGEHGIYWAIPLTELVTLCFAALLFWTCSGCRKKA